MFDLILKNGKIIDGTGSPAFFDDIAIKDGKIARIAKGLSDAREILDVKGLTVTPGFIDSHAHNDLNLPAFPEQREKVEQGITTAVAGACGTTNAPLSLEFRPEDEVEYAGLGKHSDIHRTWKSYMDTLEKLPLGCNLLCYVGHNALRRAAMGSEDRAPTADELEKMKDLVREAMENGALGVSFGLAYAPSCYAETGELIELARVVAEYHGVISAHIRNEGDHVVRAAEEFLTVVRESGARGVYSHLKALNKENRGKVCHTLRMLDEANAEGFDVYADVYPYNASHTTLSATIVPKHLHSGGVPALLTVLESAEGRREIRANCESRWQDWDWVQITICKAYPEYEGKRIPEIAALHGKDEIDTMCDIIYDSKNICSACYFNIWEEDIERVIAYPRAMICTDSGVAGNNLVHHPRLRASFPRALAKYVRERGVVTLPEMIRKITAMPAAVYGLTTKGLVREGMDADICVFDPEKIQDHATFANCHARATGLAFVLVGGEVVVKDAVHNGKRPGRMLRYRG